MLADAIDQQSQPGNRLPFHAKWSERFARASPSAESPPAPDQIDQSREHGRLALPLCPCSESFLKAAMAEY